MEVCGGCCLPLFGSKRQPQQQAPRLVISNPPPGNIHTSSIPLTPQRQTKLVRISAFEDGRQPLQQNLPIDPNRQETASVPRRTLMVGSESSPKRRGGVIPQQPLFFEGPDTQAGSPILANSDRQILETPKMSTVWSSNQRPAGFIFQKDASQLHTLPNSDNPHVRATTQPKVDTTANEDCDVDVEEDIPFVAPELLWGIKEMLARVEIQNLRNKQNGHSENPAQRELGHHYSLFMGAVGHLEQQTNRGFDWLSMLKQDSTQTGATPIAAGDLQLGQLFSKFKFEPEMSISPEHPLAKRKTGRAVGMMPSAVRVSQPGLASPPKSPPLDKAALNQINKMDREAFDEVKKDARNLADEFNLDDMSFAA